MAQVLYRGDEDGMWVSEDQKSFTGFVSDFTGRLFLNCPRCGLGVTKDELLRKVDREGDTVKWTAVCRCGAELHLFNT
jgi:hypothetical protein